MPSKANDEPAESPMPLTAALSERSPEVQKALDEWHSKIGQELVDNLNRNVLKRNR